MLPLQRTCETYWQNHRVRILQAASLILLVVARPARSNAVFFLGFFLCLLGEAVRFWAAGHMPKGSFTRGGPYAITRNPLYFGSFVIACGFAIICTSRRHWLTTIIVWAAVFAVFYWLYGERIKHEESELHQRFGSEFDAYRREVPAFWPDLGRWRDAAQTTEWEFRRALRAKEQRTVWALLGLALFLRFKMVYI